MRHTKSPDGKIVSSRNSFRHRTFVPFRLLVIVGVVIFSLFPIYWMLVVAFSPEEQAFAGDTSLLPTAALTLDNFRNLFVRFPFDRYFINSVLVAVGTTSVTVLVAIPAAYSFTQFQFRGRKSILMTTLAVYLIPPIVLIVPFMIMYHRLGLFDTHLGLVLANSATMIPFATWLLVGFFVTIPRDLVHAALVDGCGHLGALIRVVLPIAIPGIIAAGSLVFVITWNEFLFAFSLTSGDNARTLQVAMRPFVRGEGGVFWGTVMSGATLAAVPVMALFLFFQKYLVGGLAQGGVKG